VEVDSAAENDDLAAAVVAVDLEVTKGEEDMVAEKGAEAEVTVVAMVEAAAVVDDMAETAKEATVVSAEDTAAVAPAANLSVATDAEVVVEVTTTIPAINWDRRFRRYPRLTQPRAEDPIF